MSEVKLTNTVVLLPMRVSWEDEGGQTGGNSLVFVDPQNGNCYMTDGGTGLKAMDGDQAAIIKAMFSKRPVIREVPEGMPPMPPRPQPEDPKKDDE